MGMKMIREYRWLYNLKGQIKWCWHRWKKRKGVKVLKRYDNF